MSIMLLKYMSHLRVHVLLHTGECYVSACLGKTVCGERTCISNEIFLTGKTLILRKLL